ncbi:7-deoxyloganetic acid glucosyltransferase-like [Euphorbia lathyris]|uniref:7-deoxyloganetic acid glucosyltransferase-like n=1 Tax=Euphorbia lathyris TaxID=212925 RepID=UPI003313CE13
MNTEGSNPHVLIFPAPGQGHVNSMLKLAQVLYLSGLTNITFLNYQSIHEKLVLCSDIQSRFLSKYPGFRFRTIPDCMPMNSRSKDSAGWLRMLLEKMELNSKPAFMKMLSEIHPTVDFIIGDMLMSYVHDVSLEIGIPSIQFHTISACSSWVFYSIPDIVAAQERPIKGEEDMDRLITAVPGMEAILRCRDLPKKFCQVTDTTNQNLYLCTNIMKEAKSLILNTFEELEGPILSQIRTKYPNTYTIGPVNELLKSKLKSLNSQESCTSSNSVWQVNRSCIQWLDEQPEKSVLYVSFGSVTLVTKDQIMELWYGLANSKRRFLWVMRPDSLIDEDGNVVENVPIEFEEGPKERGYVVSWAPQEDVLAHKAIGGFWTHSGWNSTIESIVAGVPMICWPYYGDQQVNSRFFGEVWKLGLDMKDCCDREIVEKMINDLMVDRKEEFAEAAARMADLARISVEEYGSSSSNLDSLIDHIRFMSVKDR